MSYRFRLPLVSGKEDLCLRLSEEAVLDHETGLEMVVVRCNECAEAFMDILDVVLARVVSDVPHLCIKCDPAANDASCDGLGPNAATWLFQ